MKGRVYIQLFGRLAVVIALFFVLNQLYLWLYWERDVDIHSNTLENLWMHEQADIIYFGESSNFYQEHPDTPKIRISDFLNRQLPQLNVEAVDNAGLDASNFLHIMRYIEEKQGVKALVVTLNLRSFGPTWIYDKNYNYLRKADALIDEGPALWNRFRLALKDYGYLTEVERMEKMREAKNKPYEVFDSFRFESMAQWNQHVANGSILREDGSWDMEKISLASHYIKNFAFEIEPENNPRIADFDQIVSFARANNYPLYFHLMSENVREAQKLVGPELVAMMTYNKQLLVNRYEKQGAIVVDNFLTVPEMEFRDRIFPTEHYSNKGKIRCARVLADSILQSKLLP